jgi:gonadotropin-releasing hormone receptor
MTLTTGVLGVDFNLNSSCRQVYDNNMLAVEHPVVPLHATDVAADSATLVNCSNNVWNESMVTQPTPPSFDEFSMIKSLVFCIMFFISLIGNVATLIQMYRMRRRKSTINTLIVNLATADLFVTFFCIATEAIWASTVQWLAGNAMCKIVRFLQVFGMYLSTNITVVISLDRCCVILDPMSRNNAPQRIRHMVTVSWILSAFFSIPQVS